MRYIMADIHGCYEEYVALLQKIGFSENDELFVVGDVIDRGPEPIKILLDFINRPNVTLVIGNHEYDFYSLMIKLEEDIKDSEYESCFLPGDLAYFNLWLQGGGCVTAEKFRELSAIDKKAVLEYLENAPLYIVLEQEEKEYILIHAGLGGFDEDKFLDEYEVYELLEERTDYSKRYYSDENTYIVTGHTPTIFIDGWEKPEVYMKKGHIALDCGCVLGGRLAAYCVENGNITYVDGR